MVKVQHFKRANFFFEKTFREFLMMRKTNKSPLIDAR